MLGFIAVTVFAYCLFIEYIWGRQIKDPFMNVLALALVTLPLDWAGRPQSIGLTLFAIGFYLLNKVYEEPDTKLRWLLPVVSVLWANLHGGALPILFAFNLLDDIHENSPWEIFFRNQLRSPSSLSRRMAAAARTGKSVFHRTMEFLGRDQRHHGLTAGRVKFCAG